MKPRKTSNKIKWSSILHITAVVAGIFGVLIFLGAWIAEVNEAFLGYSWEHLVNDAMVLFLASIAFGIGTLIYQNQERSTR